MSDETQIDPQPAPEADEREVAALADGVTDLLLDRLGSRAIEVDVLDAVHEAITQRVDALLLARRSQPAPRTVSAAEVERGAQVAYERSGLPTAWEAMPDFSRTIWRRLARAVIEAALEVTR